MPNIGLALVRVYETHEVNIIRVLIKLLKRHLLIELT